LKNKGFFNVSGQRRTFQQVFHNPAALGSIWGEPGESRFAQALHHPHSFFYFFFIEGSQEE
jgi:hypothetical protein